VESCHTGTGSTTAWRENVADRNILNEVRVDASLGVGRAEDGGQELFWTSVLETTLLGL
jgi:hypothetical protein